MQRVLVVGCGGSGKSTLARRIGAILRLPVVHLDREYWRPGWTPTPADAWNARAAEIVAADRWVVDGNFSGTLEVRAARCDTVVLFDLPRHVCMARVLRRVWTTHGRVREDMGPGCPEKLDLEFLRWVWQFRRKRRPKLLRTLQHTTARIIPIRNDADLQHLLAELATML